MTFNPADLTVVIPTSGRWDVLERTLDGLAAQSLSGFETVVVIDGLDRGAPPPPRPRVRMLAQAQAGPAAARNLGARVSDRPLLLFLGDDQIPDPNLIVRHLERHSAEPGAAVAVLGRVEWHPEVAANRINRWLDASASQFEYAQLDAEQAAWVAEYGTGGPGIDAGFGRFYSANVSLKSALLEAAGGFDEDFPAAAYEDIDLGYRAAQEGMVLRYAPTALTLHHHAYTLAGLEARFAAVGAAERLMASKHAWFQPFFHRRIHTQLDRPPVSGIWPRIHDRVPPGIERLWWPVHARADRWYHQRIADPFLAGWDSRLDLEELAAYLDDAFELESLWRHAQLVEDEAAAVGDEQRFYRTSNAYLYDLTAFAMSGTKEPYLQILRSLVAPGARLLDYGAGIGADGLRLLERGYRVEFAEFDNPSAAFLRWRLKHRGYRAPVHDLDRVGAPDAGGGLGGRGSVGGGSLGGGSVGGDSLGGGSVGGDSVGGDSVAGDSLGGGFDAAYAFDVIEHVEDPVAFLEQLEARAALVFVNLLEPVAGDISLHHDLPVRTLLRRAKARGLVVHKRLHGRSHLVGYRGTAHD